MRCFGVVDFDSDFSESIGLCIEHVKAHDFLCIVKHLVYRKTFLAPAGTNSKETKLS